MIDRGASAIYITLLGAVAVGAAFPSRSAYAQEAIPAEEQQRIDRLDALAASLQTAKVDRDRSTGNQNAVARQYRKHSELHLRFQICVATLVNENQDALLIAPLQASGLTYTVDSSKPGLGQRESGADFQRVSVTLAGVRQPAPKAKIDVPRLRHGSAFDAVQLARDEIIERIRRYFPDAQVEGKQKFYAKQLAVKNATDEPLRVWLHYRSMKRSETGATWVWGPAKPGEGKPLEAAIPAGAVVTVVDPDSGSPIEASGVRIWAESDSGEQWHEHKSALLALVEPNVALDGERAYYGEQPATYTHVIAPHPGVREFAERVLEFRNESTESLSAQLRYHTEIDGRLVWRMAKLTLRPGETATPVDSQNMRLRASRLQLSAETLNRKYDKHSRDQLWLIDEVGGRRTYQATKIGKFVYVFTAAGEGAQSSRAQVKAKSATVMDGSRLIANVAQGQSLEVVARRPGWIGVRVAVNGVAQTGWIREQDAALAATGPINDPGEPVQRVLTVASSPAQLKVGTTTIATLVRGTRYPVLEERDGWYRIEVQLEGSTRHGWVQRNQIQLK